MLQVVNSSWEVALQEQEGLLSGVLANPPYIASRVIEGLQVSINKQTTRDCVLICDWKAVRPVYTLQADCHRMVGIKVKESLVHSSRA